MVVSDANKLQEMFTRHDHTNLCNDNRTEWSPIRSVIIRVVCNHTSDRTEWSLIRSVIIRVTAKSDDRAAVVRFVYHKNDYRPNWTTRSLITT